MSTRTTALDPSARPGSCVDHFELLAAAVRADQPAFHWFWLRFRRLLHRRLLRRSKSLWSSYFTSNAATLRTVRHRRPLPSPCCETSGSSPVRPRVGRGQGDACWPTWRGQRDVGQMAQEDGQRRPIAAWLDRARIFTLPPSLPPGPTPGRRRELEATASATRRSRPAIHHRQVSAAILLPALSLRPLLR